jgi:hypothetical protein
MSYYIFLKSLRILEEFRKNPHVKIPPKSSCANFQSLGKFKNPIFNSKISFLRFRPGRPCGPLGLWPSRLPLASLLPQAEAHRPAQAAQPTRVVGVIAEVRFSFDSHLPFSVPSLYPPLTHGPHVSVPSSPPRRPTPVGNPSRCRSPRRRSAPRMSSSLYRPLIISPP